MNPFSGLTVLGRITDPAAFLSPGMRSFMAVQKACALPVQRLDLAALTGCGIGEQIAALDRHRFWLTLLGA